MRIGIVGSRRRTDRSTVEALVDSLQLTDIVISGGCIGVDSWAAERAMKRWMGTLIFYPVLVNCKTKHEMVKAYYDRNKKIVEASEIIYAFVAKDRKGGTENTIKWAEKLNVPVIIK